MPHRETDEDWRALLLPLADAQDALARLDAVFGLASEPARVGLLARLALREAAGWLLHQTGVWVSPTDLALRDAGLVGAWGLAEHAGRLADAMPDTAGHGAPWDTAPADDRLVARALGLAHHWRALPQEEAVLVNGDGPDSDGLRRALGDLGGVLDDENWQGALATGDDDLPPLLRAARVARDWQYERGAGEGGRLSPAALFLAATVWQGGRPDGLPLPLWSASAPLLHALALGRGSWVGGFLGVVAAAAREALAALRRLQGTEQRGLALAASATARSSLGAAAEAALLLPVLNPRILAARLGVSTRAGLALADQLTQGGVLREVTGRGAWRAYALVVD